MNRFDLVLIDADDTLFDFRRSEEAALDMVLAPLLRAAGKDCDGSVKALYHGINGRAWAAVEAGTLDREELKTRRFAELFAALGMDGTGGTSGRAGMAATAQKAGCDYLEALSSQTWLLEGAVEICGWLRSRALLVLLTNGIARVQRGRISGSPLAQAFDHVVISEEVGFSKPDPRIFAHAAALAGVPAHERILMVGDSLSSDIAGGRAFGIATCWFNPRRLDAGPEKPSFEIQELCGLRALMV